MSKLSRQLHSIRDLVLQPGTRQRAVYDRATWWMLRTAARTVRRAGPTDYELWKSANWPSRADLVGLRDTARTLRGPSFSLLIAEPAASTRATRQTVSSIADQVYSNWQVIIAPEPGDNTYWSPRGGFIRTITPRGNPTRSSRLNAALEAATGEYVAVVRAGMLLRPDALFRFASALAARPNTPLAYCDEEVISGRSGRRVATAFFKPDWSPDLFLSMNYLGGLVISQRSIAVRAGGFREGYDGAEAYDLLLRITDQAVSPVHITDVLCSSDNSLYREILVPKESGRFAIEDTVRRRQLSGAATHIGTTGYRVRYVVVDRSPSVEIIIPTRDKVDLLKKCIDSIATRSTYRNYRITVIDNGSREQATIEYLRSIERDHTIVRDDRPFNWSLLNNSIANGSQAQFLLFMNNDMAVINSDWIEALLEHGQRKDVGAVGAQLLYADGSIQHAGILIGVAGAANHAFRHARVPEATYFGMAGLVRNYSAVTGACLLTSRSLFQELGGFDERLPVAYNDVDYCLRAREKGRYVVYTPFAKLYHFESATRGALHPDADESRFRERWQDTMMRDPYYNPNLDTTNERFEIAVPKDRWWLRAS